MMNMLRKLFTGLVNHFAAADACAVQAEINCSSVISDCPVIC